MDKLNIIFLTIAFTSILCAATAILLYRKRTKSIMMQLDSMLTAAISGEFQEKTFDESLLSSIETKLVHYLSASAVSASSLVEEKDKIKELIADISHQTKTPIANILLYSQLLEEQLPAQQLSCDSISCVAALNSQAEKLSFLIDSLVKISRLEAGVFKLHPRPSEVKPMLDTVIEQILPKAQAKKIMISLRPTQTQACFDSKWTTEAIYNIADNAVKYTPEGGFIKIETTVYNLFLRIDITDNGMGIAENEQANIFGRFYRSATVKDSEGVGIGLYLSRQIISGQGGYIRVKSSRKTGSVFSVFLPVEQ